MGKEYSFWDPVAKVDPAGDLASWKILSSAPASPLFQCIMHHARGTTQMGKVRGGASPTLGGVGHFIPWYMRVINVDFYMLIFHFGVGVGIGVGVGGGEVVGGFFRWLVCVFHAVPLVVLCVTMHAI